MKRNCEICESNNLSQLYQQKFILTDNQNFSYKVLVCNRCGFIFASDVYSPKIYKQYYKKNTKYVYQHHRGEVPEYMREFHLKSFKMIEAVLKNDSRLNNKNKIRILDIGCATGYLLSIFSKNNYKNIFGIDPAPECSSVAKRLYNIKVFSKTLLDFDSRQKFDLIIFSSVLEHLDEIDKNLDKARSLLNDNGYLYISVPDGAKFGKILKEPFLEFSIEHINYFTKGSLMNLLSKFGFKNIKSKSLPVTGYGGYALDSLWQLSRQKNKISFDKFGRTSILNYIRNSNKKLVIIGKKIDKLIRSQEEVVIWGVGSLTSRLMTTTNLKKTNLKFFVDSNKSLQEKKFINRLIKSPENLKGKKYSVLILSFNSGKEIKNILLTKYNYKGKIISL